jgi:hypothetical protein
MMWNHHLNLIWPLWPWVVQPWWVDLMIDGLMVLKILQVFLVKPKGDHSFLHHAHLNPFL